MPVTVIDEYRYCYQSKPDNQWIEYHLARIELYLFLVLCTYTGDDYQHERNHLRVGQELIHGQYPEPVMKTVHDTS